MTFDSKLIRVFDKFKDEIEEMRDSRTKSNMSKLSYTKITALMVRHKQWQLMKSDIINFIGFEDE